MLYTDEILNTLIKCPKRVIDPPKSKEGGRGGFTKKVFTLSSLDGHETFSCFFTQSEMFSENFSLGLMHIPKGEKSGIVLLRVNGKHGGTKAHPHHAYFHIHKATADRINEGLKPEGHIEEATEYSSYESAIQFFVKLIELNVSDRRKHFPPPTLQNPLFEDLIN